MNEKLADIINKIRANKGQAPLGAIGGGTRLREDTGFDSFDLAELTVNIEEEFGVDVFESGLVETVGELCKKLQK